MNSSAIYILLAIVIAAVAGCAAQRPVLYPNETLQKQGSERAQQAIDECIQLAQEHGAGSSRAGAVAGRAATGGAVGAASGAAVGAVLGSAGTGAAAGAAGGASRGLLAGLFGSREPDPVFRQFVDQCLRDKGYEPIGWR